MLLECCERSLNDIRRQSVRIVYVGKEASMAEIWHTDVQQSTGVAQMEAAGAPTNHQEEPDMYCNPC
jgi:hypothetical protein